MKINEYWIICLIVIGFTLRLICLQAMDLTPSDNELQEDAQLFDHLIKSELLKVNKKDIFELPKKDFELIKKSRIARFPGSPDLSLEEKKQCKWINDLYHTLPGQYIINQIKYWNQSRQLAVIRDNRPVHAKNLKNEWHIKNTPGTFRTISGLSERFGYINNGVLRSGFGNWVSVHPYQSDDLIQFQTVLELEHSCELTVQLIGKYPIKIHPAGSASRPKRICVHNNSKKNPCTNKTAQAFEITFFLKKGKHILKIVTQAIQTQHQSEAGVHIQKDLKTMAFSWNPLTKRRQWVKTDTPLSIYSADGIELTDSHGNPTAFTLENGLLPLIGLGKQTPFALYGLLSRSKLALKTDKVVLSINSQIQSIAQKTLNTHISRMQKLDKKYKQNKLSKKRKASVVLLNANTGQILAVANYPIPPKNVHPWDIVTFDRFFSSSNPMTLQAWQGIGKHSAPGSSFKPVVVMTALDNFTYKKVDSILQDISDVSPLYDQSTKMADFYNSHIKNKPKKYWKKIFPCFKPTQNFKMSMTKAITDSNNVWHRRLAILMDGEKAFSYDFEYMSTGNQPTNIPDFNICRMAKQLGFGKPVNLAPYLEQEIRLKPDMNKHIMGDVLFAFTGNLALSKHSYPMMLKLATTSLGHSISTTPLQMARVAACIATEKLVTPFLFTNDNNSLLKDSSQKRPFSFSGLKILQKAMGDVVQKGKTRQAFAGYSGYTRVCGKTGTANMFKSYDYNKNNKQIKKNYNTTWFIGWQKPDNEKLKYPLAFACMVTHAAHPGNRLGREVSAPVIRDILKQIDEKIPSITGD